MLIAFPVAGLEACGVDRELDCWVGAQIEPALVAVEVTLDCHKAPEVGDVELDARAGWVKTPGASGEILDL